MISTTSAVRPRGDLIETLVLKYSVLLLAIGVSAVLVLTTTSPWFGIAGLALLVIVALSLSKMELLHPYTWYIPLLFLYSASVPVLICVGLRRDIGSLRETIYIQWLAMSVFMLAIGPPVGRRPARMRPDSNLTIPSKILFYVALGFSGLYIYGIWSNGLTSKFAIAMSDSPLLRLNASFSILALAFAVLLADTLVHKRVPWFLVPFTVGWVVFAFGYSGERALVFRILWITLFIIHAVYRRIAPKLLLALGAGALLLVSVLANYKAKNLDDTYDYALRDTATLDLKFIAQIIFADEFITASENLQLLIESSPWPRYHGETLWWDMKQILLFGVRTGPAPTSYFNSFFFPEVVDRGGGRGFTLVGEGYMNFGASGVALWFLLLGLFVRFLYVKGTRSILWLAVYVVVMPIIAYATRADFSNIFSPFIKHMIGPALVILFLRKLLYGNVPGSSQLAGRRGSILVLNQDGQNQ